MNKFVNNIKKYITIGFAGSQNRIGTTTQALQMLQYLQLMGKKVCYIEMNDSMYVEIRVIVAGAKPNEMFETTDCLREKSFFDVKYIFSFIPKEDRESIKEMMEEKKDNTFFAALNIVDPFVYNSNANSMFKDIVDM